MLLGRKKVELVVFLLLSVGVAGNLFLFQRGGRSAAIERSAEGASTSQRGRLSSVGTQKPGGRLANEVVRTKLAPVAKGLKNSIAAADPDTAKEGDETFRVTRAIQRELKSRGYETGAADGVPGVMTRAAIMAFESDHGLPLTGQPSDKLLKYILLGVDTGAANTADAGRVQTTQAEDVIRSVQVSLAKLGYRPGRINGALGPSTKMAIRAFESDQALPETGRVSGPLISRLGRLAGGGRVASGL